ncbi:MAG: hypothetical protein KBB50_02340 [Candidatus Pacebacteria bacterium]|nr:hypothetical protein [Candidatus Paceibacterota bacterium]
MTNSADIKETIAAREAIAKAKASASSAASMPGSMPNKGTVHPQQPIVTHVTTGNGGNKPPHSPNKGGGGGSSGNGGFGSWWQKQPPLIKGVGIVVLYGVLSFSLNMFTISNGERSNNAEIGMALKAAKAEAEIASLKESAAVSKARAAELLKNIEKKVVTDTPVGLPTDTMPTFDCLTIEKMENNFKTTNSISLPSGKQYLFINGCAKVTFEGVVTSLKGNGYWISFDSIDDPSAEYCAYGARGRNDSPDVCLGYIKKHQYLGKPMNIIVQGGKDNFLKIGV